MRQKSMYSDLERDIRDFLMTHQGRESAVPRADLCDQFPHVSERTLRHTIKHLVAKHGYPIGSCPQGYFWAKTWQEIDEVCRYYKNYALSSLYVISRLKGEPLSRILGQLTFENLEGSPAPQKDSARDHTAREVSPFNADGERGDL